MDFLKSASKIVFITIGLTACVALMINKLESKDFMILAISAFSYYFTKKKE